MTTHRDLTTPEEVLAALRAGERVESCLRDSGWERTALPGSADEATVADCIAAGISYRAASVAPRPRPRTFTAAEVAEAMRSVAPPKLDGLLSDEDGGYNEAIDELHERITHWLRENEG